MTKSPAFQFYPDDFLGSGKVGMMTAQEVGIYILLLCLDWNDGGFALDRTRLARWCKTDEETFTASWTIVGRCFDQHEGRWYNERLQNERDKQAKWREKSRNGGLKSGRIRSYPSNHPMNHLATTVQPPYEPFANTPTPTPTPTLLTTTATATHADQFEDAGQQTAYLELRKAANLGVSFDAGLIAVVTPIGGGKAYPWSIVGRALQDFYTMHGSTKMSPAALRAFCKRIKDDDARPTDQLPRGASKQERGRAALADTLTRRGFTNGLDHPDSQVPRAIPGALPNPRHNGPDS